MSIKDAQEIANELGIERDLVTYDMYVEHRIKAIRKYCNKLMWSDIEPFEVVNIISDKTVEIRPMKATLVKGPQNVLMGGFVAHVVDNGGTWNIESDETEDVIRVRWSKSKRQWRDKYGNRYGMSDNPSKYYDYNF